MMNCTREKGDWFDPFAVSLQCCWPHARKISAICSLFMCCGGAKSQEAGSIQAVISAGLAH